MQTTKMDAAALEQASAAFGAGLSETKRRLGPDFPWYPYGSLANFAHLKPILQDHPLDALVAGGPVLDIGAADGEVAFFLESLGYTVAIVDHAPTNYNSLRGARMLADHMGSAVTISDVDLDSAFQLPGENYDLIFFLGILYHIKNPLYAMEHLARRSRHVLVSTRVARFAPQGHPIRDIPVGYLVGPLESNSDATNYWIFSETGLKQLFTRSGWDVLSFHTVGDTMISDPVRADRDERAFALLRSRHF